MIYSCSFKIVMIAPLKSLFILSSVSSFSETFPLNYFFLFIGHTFFFYMSYDYSKYGILHFIYVCIYFIWKAETVMSLISWFPPQTPPVARSGPGWNWKLGTQSGAPTWVTEAQLLGHHQLPPWMHISRKQGQTWGCDSNPGTLMWASPVLS